MWTFSIYRDSRLSRCMETQGACLKRWQAEGKAEAFTFVLPLLLGVLVLGRIIVKHQVPWKHLFNTRAGAPEEPAACSALSGSQQLMLLQSAWFLGQSSVHSDSVPSVRSSLSMAPAITQLVSLEGGGTEQQVLGQFASDSLVLGCVWSFQLHSCS